MAEQEEQLAEWVHYGPWQIPMCVKHCLCSDGRRRYARITSPEHDTFFSIPAFVQVKGKTVNGYVTGVTPSREDGKEDYEFHAYNYGKNGHLLPNK